MTSPIAIAIAGVAGGCVFHGAPKTGEGERAALMRLYKMYSRSLAAYRPVRTLVNLADEEAHVVLARVRQRQPTLSVTEAAAVRHGALAALAAAADWSSMCSSEQSEVTSVSTVMAREAEKRPSSGLADALADAPDALADERARSPPPAPDPIRRVVDAMVALRHCVSACSSGPSYVVDEKPFEAEDAAAFVVEALADVVCLARPWRSPCRVDDDDMRSMLRQTTAQLNSLPTLQWIRVMNKNPQVDDPIAVMAWDVLEGWHGVRCFWIEQLIVSDEVQRCGIGSQLLLVAQALAQERKCDVVALDVHKTNVNALRFYDRRGFWRTLSASTATVHGRWKDTVTRFLPLSASAHRLKRLPRKKEGPSLFAEGELGLFLDEDIRPGDVAGVYDEYVARERRLTASENDEAEGMCPDGYMWSDWVMQGGGVGSHGGNEATLIYVDGKDAINGKINHGCEDTSVLRQCSSGSMRLFARCAHMSKANRWRACMREECVLRAGTELSLVYGHRNWRKRQKPC